MSTPITLQKEELQVLSDLQSKYQQKVFMFGQFYLERLVLDEKIRNLAEAENKAKEEYLLIQSEEQAWTSKIAEKYGDGSLSLKDGTFTPSV